MMQIIKYIATISGCNSYRDYERFDMFRNVAWIWCFFNYLDL